MRPQRLHGLRPRRRGHRHVPQDEDREAVQPAQPGLRRGEQGLGVLHANGALGELAAQLARPGGHPHQHDREGAAAPAGHDQAAADGAAAHAGRRVAVAHHVQGGGGLAPVAAPHARRRAQAGQRAAAGARRGDVRARAAARHAAGQRVGAVAGRGGRGARAGGAPRGARAAGRGAGARGGGARVRRVRGVRARALVVPAADARVQDLRRLARARRATL